MSEKNNSSGLTTWEEGSLPPHDTTNFLQSRTDDSILHAFENGISEWDIKTAYTKGALVIGGDDHIYQSKSNDNIGVVVTDKAAWDRRFYLPTGVIGRAGYTVRSNVAGDGYVLAAPAINKLKNKIINGDLVGWLEHVDFNGVFDSYTASRWRVKFASQGNGLRVSRQAVNATEASQFFSECHYAPEYYMRIEPALPGGGGS